MPTHDYVIDNSTGGNVRADINLVLKAILTNNGGSTDPATVISTDVGSKAFSFWADTNSSPAVLKIRNAADNDWIELFQLDGTLTLEDGSASTPGLAFRDDLNTGIFSSAADTFNVATAGVERMELGATTIFNEDGADVDFRIEGDSEANLFYVDAGNDRVGIGTSSPSRRFHVLTSANDEVATFKNSDTTNGYGVNIQGGGSASGRYILRLAEGGGNEKLRVTAGGDVGIGTTTPSNLLHLKSGSPAIRLEDTDANGSAFSMIEDNNGLLKLRNDAGNSGTGSGITFEVDASERMRINSDGVMVINGTTTFDTVSSALLQIKGDNSAGIAVTGNSDQSQSRISFFNPNGRVGVIVTTDSTTTYGTTSDYRLKENATAISDGITRIKTLKPYRFNFKSNATKTLDGFFAHEVTAVPEAIVGTKDEVDSDNNPIYQGIDQSKLVPLLVAAVQELITKVAALEAA